MKLKAQNLRRRVGASASEQPLTSGPSRGLSRAEINTIVRRLGFVALKAFETMQGNLISSNQHELAEALNDGLKPLVDMLVHFEIDSELAQAEPDTEVDHEVP